MLRRSWIIAILLTLSLTIGRAKIGSGDEEKPFTNDSAIEFVAPELPNGGATDATIREPHRVERLPPPEGSLVAPGRDEDGSEKSLLPSPTEEFPERLRAPEGATALDDDQIQRLPPSDFQRLPPSEIERLPLSEFQRLPSSEIERLPPAPSTPADDEVVFDGIVGEDSTLVPTDEVEFGDLGGGDVDGGDQPDNDRDFVVPNPVMTDPSTLFEAPLSETFGDGPVDNGPVGDGPVGDGPVEWDSAYPNGSLADGGFSSELTPDGATPFEVPDLDQISSQRPPTYGQMKPAWWRPLVSRPMRSSSQPLPISLQQLLAVAVCHSDQIKVFSDSPLIRDMIIVEEDAEFDWVGFTENLWNDISEPVGSTLTTGGPPRFEDERVESRFGLRRRTTSGGRFEATQEFGHHNSNSVFFQPNNQGTSQLTLNYTQPLMRGAGRVYNSSMIVLAQLDASIARDEFSSQLQTYLLDVTNAYWTLFQQRAALLQKERLFKRGQEILENLEHRHEIDALASQIVRARAAVAIRRADLYRAATKVKNAESRVRALVNAPQLGLVDQFELLPVDTPGLDHISVGMAEAMTLAIRNRPELHQAVKRIKAAAVRKKMSANELLPVFDIILETYVRGLRGDSEVFEAFGDAFSDGAPSYTAGFQMEIPLGNRSARAAMRRREIEFRQLKSQFRATVDVLQLEVEVVVREVETAHLEIKAKHQSMQAAQHEVEYLRERWKILSGEDRSASLLLEDLLAAQERLANEELGFLSAQISYSQALTDLKQVTGSLLQLEDVDVRTQPGPDGNPVMQPMKRSIYPTQQVSAYQLIEDQIQSQQSPQGVPFAIP